MEITGQQLEHRKCGMSSVKDRQLKQAACERLPGLSESLGYLLAALGDEYTLQARYMVYSDYSAAFDQYKRATELIADRRECRFIKTLKAGRTERDDLESFNQKEAGRGLRTGAPSKTFVRRQGAWNALAFCHHRILQLQGVGVRQDNRRPNREDDSRNTQHNPCRPRGGLRNNIRV